MLQPMDEQALCAAIADASAGGRRLAIRGGGSKRDIGRPVGEGAVTLDMRGLAGVVDYDPPELVLTVRPGTPLAEVEALVAGQGQMLAFEPFDHGPIFGRPDGAATIGGVVAAGIAGSQRLSAGSARDHVLGMRAVSGRGEVFVSGAKVVKNVTGYDLPKLLTGSWGQLAAITEITLKVMPAPRIRATRILTGLAPARAVAAMAAAMGSPAEVAAAAHLPGSESLTAFRIQGFHASVAARCDMLAARLAEFGSLHDPGEAEGERIWQALRTLSLLPAAAPLWRINVPPAAGAMVLDTLAQEGGHGLMDWAGGLLWAATDADPAIVRALAERAGGHAMLVRGHADAPTFHPQPPTLAALEERVRRAFDPAGLFETGRF